jgi:hypothetical protein
MNTAGYHERVPLNPYSDHLIQPPLMQYDNSKINQYRRQGFPSDEQNERGNYSQQNTGTYNSSNSGNYADIPHPEYSNSERENFMTRENNCYERGTQANFNGNLGNFVSHPNLELQRSILPIDPHRNNMSNPNLDSRVYFSNKSVPHHGNYANHYSDSSVLEMKGEMENYSRKENRNCGINLRDILPSPPEQPYGSCADYRYYFVFLH